MGFAMIRSKARFAIIIFILFSSLLFVMIQQVSAGTPIDVGWMDHSFGTSVNNPTAEKPQSKLWFNNGIWWGALYQPSASAFTIHRFDWATDNWTNTGVVIDAREDSHIDTLWDGSKLFIISHGTSSTTSGDSAQVRRYSYNSGSQTYTLDAGFPVTVSTGGMEAAVIAKDSTGILWITFTQNSGYIYVSHSNAAHTTWTTPYVLPFTNEADGQADDISSIIAFGGNKIGVMWSNQNTDAFYFAVHQDGAADNAWTLETSLQGSNVADDHINLSADSTGKIYAAVKTSAPTSQPTSALIRLLVRQTNGTWASYTFGRVSDNHTRPIVLIDEETRNIYMLATFPTGSDTQGEIRYKMTSMDNIAFPVGAGTQFIYNSAHQYINNVSSTKQNITCASGILVIADDNGSDFYFHNKATCGMGVINPPTATPTPTATATGTPTPPSQRIKDITFENGTLTHVTTGADVVSGTVLLEETNPLKGLYSARLAPLNASPYLEENFTATNDFYMSFYIRVNSYPSSDVRLVLISNAGNTIGNIQIRPSGTLRLRNNSTTIGVESSALALGQLYRIGIQQTKGTGTNAVLRAWLSPNDNAFGSPFAQITNGTWTSAADRVRLGATTAGTFNILFDDIRLDTTAMPGASNPPNTPPTISDVTNKNVSMNSSTAAIAFTVGDVETAAASLVVTASSSDQVVVPNANIVLGGSGANRTVTITPAIGQSDSVTITLTVSDGISNTSDTFVLTVTNTAPTISNVADQSINANTSTSALAVTVGDAETAAASLVMSASSSDTTLVPNANIVFGGSGTNRTVTVTPATNQAGSATITITVSDGITTSDDTFVLTVVPPPNTSPTISDVTNQIISMNSSTSVLAFTIGDAETAAGSLVMSGSSSNTTLVPNANIVFGGSGANRTVIVTPATGQAGSATITLTVSDPFASTSDTFVLTVTNTMPTISDVANQSISTNGATSALAFTIGDAETAAANLVMSGSSSNTTLVPNANIVFGGSGTNRTVTVTPATNQAGTATITLTVSDGVATSSDTFVLTVTNTAPTISDITDQSTQVNSPTAALAFTIGDAETAAANLVLTAASSNPSLVPVVNIVFGGSGTNRTVTITPAANQAGSTTIGITVSDGLTTSMDTFILTVTNTAPTISDVTDQTITANTSTSALAFTVADAQSTAASLGLTGSSSDQILVPNANIVFGGSGANRTVTVTPAANRTGSATITVTVSDGFAESSDTFVLTVNPQTGTTVLNFLPTDDAYVRSDSANSNYGSLDHIRMRGTAAFYNSYLKFNLTGINGTVTNARLRLFSFDGTSNGSSVYAVSNNYLSTSTPWLQSGLTWNNAPTIGGSPIATTTTAIVNNTWAEYVVTSAITGNGTYSFGTTIDGSNSLYFNSLEATSNQPVLEITFTNSSNTAPTISDVSDQTITANSATSALAFTIGDAETPAANLQLSASSSNTGLVPNANIVLGGSGANRTVTVTPNLNQTGTAIITLTVGDGMLTVSDTFVLTVTIGGGTTTLTYSPTDDAYVRSDNSNSNYGSADHLRMRGTDIVYNSYLKFNVTGLAGTITSARLLLYSYDGSNEGGSVYLVSNNYLGTSTPWLETGLTWNNAPGVSGSPLFTRTGTIANNTLVEYDVTSAITADGVYSFGMSIVGTNSLYFYSDEAASNRPILEITVNGGGGEGVTSIFGRPDVTTDATIILPEPTAVPTEVIVPTEIVPSETPVVELPTVEPTALPTEAIVVPTEVPTELPTEAPSEVPAVPTEAPTEEPTSTP
jgi:hypothetical protein